MYMLSIVFAPVRYLISFELESLQSERCLTDICKVAMESKCTQGQTFIKSVWNHFAILLSLLGVDLMLSFWSRDEFIKFENSGCFPTFSSFYIGTAWPKNRQSVTGAYCGMNEAQPPK